jgi:16S rRNA (cytidine1402-2'-O)-methyltransferase
LILYAIPTPLGGKPVDALPAPALETIRGIGDFVVEDAKTARAFLNAVGMPRPLQEISVVQIEEKADFGKLLQPLRDARPLGLLSEAGCPAIADPGAGLIELAHEEQYKVVPLVGPSSIVLALMASGLEGQRFAFCGYLPREKADRERRIRELEKRSRAERETEIFIETPYRTDALLSSLLESCSETTMLCVASNLTLADEEIRTRSIREWRRAKRPAGKRPAVFLLLSR